MPIQIRCQCGKALKVPDSMSGKPIKCPACGKAMRVPVAKKSSGAGTSSANQGAAQTQASQRAGYDDLFDEAGFSERVEAVCPACRNEMPGDAVLCTKCGFHKELGIRLESHKTAGVDIDHGTLALQKAETDLVKDKEMQEKMLKGSGLPWWGLALVLFIVGSGVTIAVLEVNARRSVEEVDRNSMALFLMLSGIACGLVAAGAYWMIIVHGCKKMGKKGLLNLIPPYALFYVGMNFKQTWRYLLVLLVLGGVSAGLIVEAINRGF